MADTTEADQSPARIQLPTGSDSHPSLYWCYHCNKRVSVETHADLFDVVCEECKNGFVESISASDSTEDRTLGNQFAQVLRDLAQNAIEDHTSRSPPPDQLDEDYLRIDLDRWNNGRDEDADEGEEVGVVREEDADNRENNAENGSDVEDDAERVSIESRDEYEDDETLRRRREAIRVRIRDFANRAARRRNRILDFTEILMGVVDHPFDMRLQVPESESYVGNPGDYVDDAGYEALLHNLVENGSGGRCGAPPAAKAAVEVLESVMIEKEEEAVMCAVCKDLVNVGEVSKKLPCGHLYHDDCIIPWLESRNSCPVCRFELRTDDLEYEEERKKRVAAGLMAASPSSSASGGSRPHMAFD